MLVTKFFSLSIIFLSSFLYAVSPQDILSGDTQHPDNDMLIRIGIFTGLSSCELKGDAVVRTASGKEIGRIQGQYIVSLPGKDGIMIGEKKYEETLLELVPKFAFIGVNDKLFRGGIELVNDGGSLTVINVLGLEEYVRGVINKEILPGWSIETKKAQAVLARTYAFYQKTHNPRTALYDLAPSVLDQVYGGLSKEDISANEAVLATKGEILTWEHKPAQIFFHSTCGGHTSSSQAVWGKKIPYLNQVSCRYCKNSSLYRWTRSVPEKKLIEKLASEGISSLQSIKVIKKEGRVSQVVVNGKSIPVNLFRKYVGYSVIWSNDFNVSIKGGSVIFTGKGAGHGVGACQWGMEGLAREGKTYHQILEYYFKGAEIEKLY